MIRALFCKSASFDKTPHGYFSLDSSLYANDLLLKLFEILPKEDCYPLIDGVLQEADSITIETVAVFLNTQELAYGRLAANGVPKDYKKVVSEAELCEFEIVFVRKIKDLVKEKPLLEFDNCRMIIYLLECFGCDYIKQYLTEQFDEPSNIVRYLKYSASIWNGSGVSYEIRDDYKKYITDSQIISAIEQCRDNGALSSLPENAQIMSAVYWLFFNNKFDYDNHISEKTAKQLLKDWQL